MLLLQLSSANSLYVVCDDILTIADPYYLWRFYNEQTKQEYLIELTNSQEANPRFDLFTLTLPTDLNLLEGEYRWYIYESATTGVTDYTTLNLLSEGTAKVVASFDSNTSYEPTGTDKVYTG